MASAIISAIHTRQLSVVFQNSTLLHHHSSESCNLHNVDREVSLHPAKSDRPYNAFRDWFLAWNLVKSLMNLNPSSAVPFKYHDCSTCLAACRCFSPGLWRYLDKNVTAKPRSECVHWNKFIRDPTMALYSLCSLDLLYLENPSSWDLSLATEVFSLVYN